jgi:hypothetical protein
MRKLCWMALQAAIVAGTVWLDDRAAMNHEGPNVGVAFGLGICVAFIVTAVTRVMRESFWLYLVTASS